MPPNNPIVILRTQQLGRHRGVERRRVSALFLYEIEEPYTTTTGFPLPPTSDALFGVQAPLAKLAGVLSDRELIQLRDGTLGFVLIDVDVPFGSTLAQIRKELQARYRSERPKVLARWEHEFRFFGRRLPAGGA